MDPGREYGARRKSVVRERDQAGVNSVYRQGPRCHKGGGLKK